MSLPAAAANLETEKTMNGIMVRIGTETGTMQQGTTSDDSPVEMKILQNIVTLTPPLRTLLPRMDMTIGFRRRSDG